MDHPEVSDRIEGVTQPLGPVLSPTPLIQGVDTFTLLERLLGPIDMKCILGKEVTEIIPDM